MHKLSKPRFTSVFNRGKTSQNRRRKNQGGNKPEGEQAKGRISQAHGTNKPKGEPAKRRKSQTPPIITDERTLVVGTGSEVFSQANMPIFAHNQ